MDETEETSHGNVTAILWTVRFKVVAGLSIPLKARVQQKQQAHAQRQWCSSSGSRRS